MEYLLKEMVENRKRLLLDLKSELIEMKSDFKFLSPNYSSLGLQFNFNNVQKFLEANKYLINTTLIDLCSSFISKFHTSLNNKYSNHINIDGLNKDYNMIILEIDNEISRY